MGLLCINDKMYRGQDISYKQKIAFHTFGGDYVSQKASSYLIEGGDTLFIKIALDCFDHEDYIKEAKLYLNLSSYYEYGFSVYDAPDYDETVSFDDFDDNGNTLIGSRNKIKNAAILEKNSGRPIVFTENSEDGLVGINVTKLIRAKVLEGKDSVSMRITIGFGMLDPNNFVNFTLFDPTLSSNPTLVSVFETETKNQYNDTFEMFNGAVSHVNLKNGELGFSLPIFSSRSKSDPINITGYYQKQNDGLLGLDFKTNLEYDVFVHKNKLIITDYKGISTKFTYVDDDYMNLVSGGDYRSDLSPNSIKVSRTRYGYRIAIGMELITIEKEGNKYLVKEIHSSHNPKLIEFNWQDGDIMCTVESNDLDEVIIRKGTNGYISSISYPLENKKIDFTYENSCLNSVIEYNPHNPNEVMYHASFRRTTDVFKRIDRISNYLNGTECSRYTYLYEDYKVSKVMKTIGLEEYKEYNYLINQNIVEITNQYGKKIALYIEKEDLKIVADDKGNFIGNMKVYYDTENYDVFIGNKQVSKKRDNLLENFNFEVDSTTGMIKNYTYENITPALNVIENDFLCNVLGQNILMLGESNNIMRINQSYHKESTLASDEFGFILFGKGNFSLNRCEVVIRFIGDDSNQEKRFKFDSKDTSWQILSGNVKANKTYQYVQLELIYEGMDEAFFGGFRMYEETDDTHYDYYEDGNINGISTSSQKYEYGYNGDGLVNEVTASSGEVLDITYTNRQKIKSIKDRKSNQEIVYEYDSSLGNEKKVTLTSKRGKKRILEKEYDNYSDLIQEEDQEGYKKQYRYDSLFRLIESKNQNGIISTIKYDDKGNVKKMSSMLNDCLDECSYEYDNMGNITKVTSVNGTTYQYLYDNYGRISMIKINDIVYLENEYNHDINGYKTDLLTKTTFGTNHYILIYDNQDRPTGRKYNSTSMIEYEYNDEELLSKVKDLNNNITKDYLYDKKDNIKEVTIKENNVKKDAFLYDYDNLGNIQKRIIAHQGIKRSFDYDYSYEFKEYNNKKNLSGYQIPNSNAVMYYNHDVYKDMELITLNGTLLSTDCKKPKKYLFTEGGYSALKAKVFEYDDTLKRHVYSSYSNYSSSEGYGKSLLSYEISLESLSTVLIWVKPHSLYQADQREILLFKNNNGIEISVFLDSNNKININQEQYNVGLTEDEWNMVVIRLQGSNVGVRVNENTFITKTLNLPSLTNAEVYLGSGISSNGTPINHLNGSMQLFGHVNRILSDQEINRIYQSGQIIDIRKTYDEDGRIKEKTIKANENELVTKYYYYEEDNYQNLYPTVEVQPDGKEIVYAYDENKNVTHQLVMEDGQVIEATYNEYDEFKRLKEVMVFDGENTLLSLEGFTYDNNGNILTKRIINETGVEKNYQYYYSNSIKDRLERVKENDVTKIEIAYNNNSFMPSSYLKDGVTNTITWRGRDLVQYGDYQYSYDENGTRIKKSTSVKNTKYVLEGQSIVKVVNETQGNDVTLYYNYDEANMLVGLHMDGNEYFFIRDILGNINKIIDISGKTMVKYRYSAYGKPEKEIGSNLSSEEEVIANKLLENNIYIYKGYCYDEETGLYYLNSRFYDPEVGRFISIDDISYLDPSSIGGLNLYAYCLNNPVMYTDSTGHAIDVILDIGFFIWGLVDFINNPTWENAAWVALDLAFMIIPFATGGGKLLKGASRLDDAFDAGKALKNMDRIHDANKVAIIGRKMNRVDDAADLYKAASYSGYGPLRVFNAAHEGTKAPLKMRMAAKLDNFKWLGHKLINGYDIVDIGLGGFRMSGSVFLEQTMLFFWYHTDHMARLFQKGWF
ncbi:hypothetical protein LJC17_04940 [Acholeplasma sp. OttesenSCG-928-E16]|nr:hypothetical protein [Acholeplasma sp. OttesenSCG-928-E16]